MCTRNNKSKVTVLGKGCVNCCQGDKNSSLENYDWVKQSSTFSYCSRSGVSKLLIYIPL
jgi:hypothetical protein